MTNGLRMDAYYYGFTETCVRSIDEILSTVACAGKAYHNTSDWQDECNGYGPHCEGECPIDWIQNAATRAADEIKSLTAQVESLKRGHKGWISVDDRMPNTSRHVEATYINKRSKRRRIIAFYAKQFEIGAGPTDDLELEYSEEKDEYFWPEGWYENIDNWEDYTAIKVNEGTVDYWRELTPLPHEVSNDD